METTWSPNSPTPRRQDELSPHSTPSAAVTEAVNANVVTASHSITQPEESDSAAEGSSLTRTRLTRHARLARAIRSSTQPLQVGQADQSADPAPEIKTLQQPAEAAANQEGTKQSTCSYIVCRSEIFKKLFCVRARHHQADDNDPSKLSLTERMRLFERPPVQSTAATTAAPRKRRPLISRFQTQPITVREVHQARLINPPATASVARLDRSPSIGSLLFVNCYLRAFALSSRSYRWFHDFLLLTLSISLFTRLGFGSTCWEAMKPINGHPTCTDVYSATDNLAIT